MILNHVRMNWRQDEQPDIYKQNTVNHIHNLNPVVENVFCVYIVKILGVENLSTLQILLSLKRFVVCALHPKSRKLQDV